MESLAAEHPAWARTAAKLHDQKWIALRVAHGPQRAQQRFLTPFRSAALAARAAAPSRKPTPSRACSTEE